MLKLCPNDQSAHQLEAETCSFCGYPFSAADVHPITAFRACPSCNVYAGATASSCLYCHTPFSKYQVPGPPQPPPAYVQYPRPSAMTATYGLPPDIKAKFNWGAFYFNWIWGVNHKKPETLLILLAGLIPFGALIGMIYIGYKGNEWAWASGRFRSVEDMIECQSIWAKWALWMFILSTVLPLFFIFGFVALGGVTHAPR